MTTQTDVRAMSCRAMRVPTLRRCIATATSPCDVDEAPRYIAEHIPGARFVELPRRAIIFRGSATATRLLDEIEEFLTGHARRRATPNASLTTILCTDIAESTARRRVAGRSALARSARSATTRSCAARSRAFAAARSSRSATAFSRRSMSPHAPFVALRASRIDRSRRRHVRAGDATTSRARRQDCAARRHHRGAPIDSM